MLKKLCKFSVIRYVPDEYREEFINIGFVLHDIEGPSIMCKFTSNFSRVKAFDDEVDLEFLKLILEGLSDQFTLSTDYGPSLKELTKIDYLNEVTRHYVNQIQFSKINSIYSPDIEKDFDDLFRTYVYFETKKKNRITSDEVRRLMQRIFMDKGLFNQLERNPLLHTNYNEPIELDYSLTTENKKYFMKALSFDYKKSKQETGTTVAKTWVYNIERLLKNTDRDQYEFKFVLPDNDMNDKKKKLILDILSEISEPIAISQLDDFIDLVVPEKV
jgi:hypothetical protein